MFRSSLFVLVLAVAGCAGSVDPVGVTSETQELTVPNPNGTYVASVTANGTGCPKGTWDVSIDPAGETFTLTFSAYEASLSPSQMVTVKDCQVGVKLHSPQGLSWAVDDFFYSGYAFLDSAGMTATQTAGYYFQGNPVDSSSARSNLTGPFDDSYVFSDQINLLDLVWSKCGTDRMLNIPTRLVLKNNSGRTGSAYMNTLAVDGSAQLLFKMSTKSCP